MPSTRLIGARIHCRSFRPLTTIRRDCGMRRHISRFVPTTIRTSYGKRVSTLRAHSSPRTQGMIEHGSSQRILQPPQRSSADGDRIVTGSDDNLATIYNRTGGLGLKLRGHVQAGVLQAEFSPDGSIVATVGGDATVRLFNATNGRQRDSLIIPDEGVRCLAFSPDGTRLAVGMSDSTVVVWDITRPDSATIVRRWGIRPPSQMLRGIAPEPCLLRHVAMPVCKCSTCRFCGRSDVCHIPVRSIRWHGVRTTHAS